jgi:hypothetical protein
MMIKVKVKTVLVTGRGGPYYCETFRLPHFFTVGSQVAVRISALRSGYTIIHLEDSLHTFLLEAE